jgi:iron(III) transport system ATP-binding protein
MTSVRIENVSKRFGETIALDAIDLNIQAGELFFLLGPSGCGKSTLLRVIAGLLEPTAGRVFFNDRDVTALGTEKRNAVMCFQSYALWPHMTVEENVRFGLEVRKVPRLEQATRVAEAIRQVQLETLAKRKPNELSGGQQQRVALARALVVHPNCLLLDEPLSNLDARLRLDMRGEIRRICRAAGLTAIYVTHDQKEALSIADRMAVLNKGKIEQIGRPQDLYLRPGNLFVASFMGETNLLPGKVVGGDGILEVETAIGRLQSNAAPAGIGTGSNVTVSVRPEAIRLGEIGSGQANSFDGFVHDTVYLGEVAQHRVSIGDNGQPQTELKAFELNPKFVARDEARQRAGVWIDPADVVVLQR